MSWLPGWDTIDDADWWHNIFFWIGIAFLILLAASETLSQVYSSRKDTLTRQQQEASDKRYNKEISQLHLATNAAEARAERLETGLTSRHLTEDQALKLRAALSKLQPNLKTLIFGRIGDHEAHKYAGEIIDCVNAAGIYPSVQDLGTQNPPRYGLKVTADLKPAFDTARIHVDEVLADTGRSTTIFVGIRPPSF
jgi:hypothetical protein